MSNLLNRILQILEGEDSEASYCLTKQDLEGIANELKTCRNDAEIIDAKMGDGWTPQLAEALKDE